MRLGFGIGGVGPEVGHCGGGDGGACCCWWGSGGLVVMKLLLAVRSLRDETLI